MFSPAPPDPPVRLRIYLLAFCAIALLLIAFLAHYSVRAKPTRVLEGEVPALQFAEQEEAAFGGKVLE